MPTIPRESREYLFVLVKRDGVTITSGVRLAITNENSRPDQWVTATVIDGATAILVDSLSPGRYRVWAEATNGTERVVEAAGNFIVS